MCFSNDIADGVTKTLSFFGYSANCIVRTKGVQYARNQEWPKARKEIEMTVINKEGAEINFDAAVALMDDDIREQVNNDLAPCTEQDFFTAYETAHAKKFGAEWELSKANPTW